MADNATLAEAAGHPDSRASAVEVFCRSVAIVGVAELFDKTWFMGLLLALRYRPSIVFVGSFTALALHTVLAAALGYAFAKFLSPVVLNFLTAAVFLCFTILYTKDWYEADPEADAIEQGKEEAAEDGGVLVYQKVNSDEGPSCTDEQKQVYKTVNADGDKPSCADERHGEGDAQHDGQNAVGMLWKAFLVVFIAEWGDRTQIAMIGQHASQPLIPVFLGSLVAFFLLTLSAVGAASLLHQQKLRAKVVYRVVACCFALFTIIALRDALVSLHDGKED